MDKKRLSCAECGYQSDNLIDHIETDHADLVARGKDGKKISGLDAYVFTHKITEESQLIHPSYVEEEEKSSVEKITKEKPVKKERKEVEAEESIMILDVEIPLSLSSGGDNVPKEIPYYNFGPHAKDVALDIIDDKRVMLLGHTGCVAGDTIINLNRGGKGFAIKIEDAYKMFIGESRGNRKWDTRLQTKIRSFIESEERIGLNNAVKFVQSGVKETFTLTLEDGSTLRATSDHEIFTTRGYVALGELKADDRVICDRIVDVESNSFNNELENLEVLTHEEHRKHHGKENLRNFGRGIAVPVSIASIVKYGMEMTYDVVCEDPNRNFVANGIVIHNCGKTSLIEQIAARLKQSIVRVNLNGQTTVGDFVGLYTAKDGATEWVDGALPRAMRMGHWLVLDEIDFAEPQILSVLNSVLEPKGKLFLKEKGHEVINPHPNFRIFATANGVGCMSDFRSLYQGVNIMNEAFLDRWRCYFVDYMKPEDEVKVIIGALPRFAKAESAVQVIVKVVNMVRDAFVKEEVSCTFSTRRAIEWADLMLRHKDPVRSAEIAVFSKINKTDAEVIRGIIQRVMTKK